MSSARASTGVVTAIAAALVGALGIAFVQPGLAANVHKLRQRDDAFLLPPPNELKAMTLGYRAAAADLLWAKLLLEYGMHHQEKRAFPEVTRYIDGLIEIEPDYPLIYDFVDTIVMYRPGPVAGPEEARITRAYLERGTRERPYDPTVWLRYGQFTAYLAPTFLTDEAEMQRWRVDGAKAIARSIELGSDASRGLAASTILNKAGERSANIEHLERAYAMADDPDTREQLLRKLRLLTSDAHAEQAVTFVDSQWHSRYGFLPRGATLLIGPYRSAVACAGPASYRKRGCARDWQQAVDEAK